jgi:hypothetical protein
LSHILPRFQKALLALEDAEKIGRILRETGDPGPTNTVARATLPGDNRRLRGIPVVGFSVTGTSPGTDPLGALLWADRSESR